MKHFTIGDKEFPHNGPPLHVAEIGLNHGGSVKKAISLMFEAKNAGADAVKFQYIIPDKFINPKHPATQEAYTLFKKTALSDNDYYRLKQVASDENLLFFCSVFDEVSLNRLEDIGVELYKIASGDIINIPLLKAVAATGKPIILSTGASTLQEIDRAVRLLKRKNGKIILLHCVSEYPCDPQMVNLAAMDVLQRRYSLPVGFSDHTKGDFTAIIAAVMGAQVIEKHFMAAGDEKALDAVVSLTAEEYARMIRRCTAAVRIKGKAHKEPTTQEVATNMIGRRSLYAARDIPPGTKITRDMVAILRPADAFPPSKLLWLIGKRTNKKIAMFEAFDIEKIQ